MPLLPKKRADLALAPVAAEIDQNLQALRSRTTQEIDQVVATELNVWTRLGTADDRARWIAALATRDVDLHSWRARVSADYARIHLDGGSVPLDIGLSRSIQKWIERGVVEP